MITEEEIEARLLKEARTFVNEQIANAIDIVEKESHEDTVNHLTNILSILTGYRKALIGVSAVVSCDKVMRTIVNGEEIIHQKLVELSSYEKSIYAQKMKYI